MKEVVLALLTSASLFAAVDGVITNKTTGKPQAGVPVTLMKLGQGMTPVGTVKSDAAGKFHFDASVEAASPYLVQAQFEGVHYNKVLSPGEPAANVGVDVFNASTKVPEAKITAHMILLQPTEQGLVVNESVEYTNSGNVALNDEKNGTLRLNIPAAVANDVNVSITSPGGMPIQRPVEKTNTKDVYRLNYPVKPGPTRFDLAYTLPPTKEFATKAMMGEKMRLVVPNGVKVNGEGFKSLGVEPQTQAEIFDTPADAWKVTLEGSGTLRAGNEQQPAGGGAEAEDNGPSIEEAKPMLYGKLPWMLGFAGAILVLGFAILYRADVPARK